MERRPCGKSGLKLSVLGAGCWAYDGGSYWREQNQADVDAVARHALELGIDYFGMVQNWVTA